MKANHLYAATFAFLICIFFTGCEKQSVPQSVQDAQPTKSELLAELNEAHRSIDGGEIDASPYLRTSIDFETYQAYAPLYEKDIYENRYDGDAILTQEQAEEDVNYLFEAFYCTSALYDYFGGPSVYDSAQDSILEELEDVDAITAEELQDLLLAHISFIKDGHFSINIWNTASPTKIPFFFRATAFLKTENGYETADGKVVVSVEGHDDLNDLFKRSISSDGYLVYYPVLLKDCKLKDAYEKEQLCDESLIIHYADGSSETLIADPYQVYYDTLPDGTISKTSHEGDILVFQLNGFTERYTKDTMLGAARLRVSDIGIFDLRSNGGGTESVVYSWLKEYSGERMTGNGKRVNAYTGEATSSIRAHWVKNDSTLLVLCGKWSASGSELMLDCLYNLENCVMIGENTFGALIGNSSGVELPNSKCIVHFTQKSIYVPAQAALYFEEMVGFLPDIWVPAAEAEDLAVKLWNNLK